MTYTIGSTAQLFAQFNDAEGDGLTLDADPSFVVEEADTGDPVALSGLVVADQGAGQWRATFLLDMVAGWYRAVWEGEADGEPLEGSELFEVVPAGSVVVGECPDETWYGPCHPYLTVTQATGLGCAVCAGLDLTVGTGEEEPEPLPVDVPVNAADWALFEQALMWASRRVFMASGYRFFGCCEATIRPCRQTCDGIAVGSALPTDFPWGSWPQESLPAWVNGLVPVWACSCAATDVCSCSSWDRIPLPLLPAREIVEVVIDGVVLASTAYALVAGAWLLRIDGDPWPSCQATELPAGEVGTWSVTYRHGLDLPAEALPLVASFACQLAKRCRAADDCALPEGVRVASRDGVEFVVTEPAEYRAVGLTGYGPVDDWIGLINAGHVSEPPRLYRPGRDRSAPILEPSP